MNKLSSSNLTEDRELQEELAPYRQWLKGRILNAGCGCRYIDLGDDSVRLDINPDFAVACDIVADLHDLPFQDGDFDSILCVGVLEHTRLPWVVVKEFFRVLRPGGIVVMAVPFFQPQHGTPHDYMRWTENGARSIMEWANLKVIKIEGVHSTGFVLEWIFREILSEHPRMRKILWPIRRFVFPLLKNKLLAAPTLTLQSAYYVIAEKPDAA